ncbi:MAG TPA: hypothetical protein VIK78_00240 [Ruminiclostridium sp.]
MQIVKWVCNKNCCTCMKEVNIKPKNNLQKLQSIVIARECSAKCNGCGVLAQTREVINIELCRSY